MRPALLGWVLVLALVNGLLLSIIAGLEIRRTRTLRRELRAGMDSALTRLSRGLPIYGPDGRTYAWMDTTAPRVPILADTVRSPKR